MSLTEQAQKSREAGREAAVAAGLRPELFDELYEQLKQELDGEDAARELIPFTADEIHAAKADVAKEYRETLEEMRNAALHAKHLQATLQMACVSDQAAAQIMVRCECGTPFLKVKCDCCHNAAHCPDCGRVYVLCAGEDL